LKWTVDRNSGFNGKRRFSDMLRRLIQWKENCQFNERVWICWFCVFLEKFDEVSFASYWIEFWLFGFSSKIRTKRWLNQYRMFYCSPEILRRVKMWMFSNFYGAVVLLGCIGDRIVLLTSSWFGCIVRFICYDSFRFWLFMTVSLDLCAIRSFVKIECWSSEMSHELFLNFL
jgi:hypothetical protein